MNTETWFNTYVQKHVVAFRLAEEQRWATSNNTEVPLTPRVYNLLFFERTVKVAFDAGVVLCLVDDWATRELPKLDVHMLEALMWRYLDQVMPDIADEQVALYDFLTYLQLNLGAPIKDLKSGETINYLTSVQQVEYNTTIELYSNIVAKAIEFENKGDFELAIKYWQRFFGERSLRPNVE
ncbi:hypothetical protein [Loigolactobacillus binensis]|uniref:Uncharacterized protein n=1 Tax=Loigolactobacillus binensis TaxID=2559922 RepID=A0ABW3EEM1_9LACO|nr:hypothetical protein [Loigolactobacillus binensis]